MLFMASALRRRRARTSRIWRVIFIVSWTTQYRPTIKRTPQSRRESGQTQCVPKRMEEQDMDRSLPSR